MKGKERKRKEKWREGGGVCTSGVEGKGRRKREMGGEGRVLYEGLKGKGEEERENVGLSNANIGENPMPRKPKGSSARFVHGG